jgi:hypothetical protein
LIFQDYFGKIIGVVPRESCFLSLKLEMSEMGNLEFTIVFRRNKSAKNCVCTQDPRQHISVSTASLQGLRKHVAEIAVAAKSIFIGIAISLVLFSGFASSIDGAEIVGQLSDPENVNLDTWVDILSARIEQQGNSLTFIMEMRGDIPPVPTRPQDSITYLWFVDADNNSATGQPHGGVGSEFNVRAVISETYGGGFVDVTGSLPGGGRGTVAVQGNRIQITIGAIQIGDPLQFHWCCGTFQMINDSHVPGNPNTTIVSSNLQDYPDPSRIRLTPPLLMLSPAGPVTGNLHVEIYDADGNSLPPENYNIAWQSSNESIATVDNLGRVTVHGVPVTFWETPYIRVTVDGLAAENSSVIRSTTTDLEVTHQMFEGKHVAFYLPTIIEGTNLEQITSNYQVVEATDLAYEAHSKGIGAAPYATGLQYFILDVTDDSDTCPCGVSGNPIRLGWQFGDPIHNSCYIVNVPEKQRPQWGVIFHEMGHNFNGPILSFNKFTSVPNCVHNFTYSEGLATLAGMWSWYSLMNCTTGLTTFTRDSIHSEYAQYKGVYQRDLTNYLGNGAHYAEMNPNILDGILHEMCDSYGPKVWFDLFSTFLPASDPLPCTLDTEAQQATWFVAALSVSAGEDLRALFRDHYGFPIDDTAWPTIHACVTERISARNWQPFTTADINCDDKVNLIDFSIIAKHWLEDNCAYPRNCQGANLSGDTTTDLKDVLLFIQQWLD